MLSHGNCFFTGQGRAGEEFIFWHAVGSSRKSMEIHNLIRRLDNAVHWLLALLNCSV